MARYSRSRKRTTRYKLRPKQAEEIIRQEFIDSKGNKHIFYMDVSPHNPNLPTIESKIKYKDDE